MLFANDVMTFFLLVMMHVSLQFLPYDCDIACCKWCMCSCACMSFLQTIVFPHLSLHPQSLHIPMNVHKDPQLGQPEELP